MRTKTLHRHAFTAILAAMFSAATLLGTGGCANDAQAGAGIGAGLGAIGGAIIGHQSGHAGEGAAIGAGAGALGGYIIGNESDKARYRQHRDPRYNY